MNLLEKIEKIEKELNDLFMEFYLVSPIDLFKSEIIENSRKFIKFLKKNFEFNGKGLVKEIIFSVKETTGYDIKLIKEVLENWRKLSFYYRNKKDEKDLFVYLLIDNWFNSKISEYEKVLLGIKNYYDRQKEHQLSLIDLYIKRTSPNLERRGYRYSYNQKNKAYEFFKKGVKGKYKQTFQINNNGSVTFWPIELNNEEKEKAIKNNEEFGYGFLDKIISKGFGSIKISEFNKYLLFLEYFYKGEEIHPLKVFSEII